MEPNLSFNVSSEEIYRLADLIASAPVDYYNINNRNMGLLDYVPLEELDLEAMASALAGITDPWGQLKEWLQGMFEWVKNAIIGALAPLIQGVQSIVSGIADAVSALGSTLDSLLSSFESLTSGIADWFSRILNILVSLPSQISDVVSSLISSISSTISDLASSISNIISAVESAISNGLQNIVNMFSGFLTNIQEALSSIESAIGSIVSSVQSIVSSVVSQLQNIGSSLLSSIQSLVNSVVSTINNIVSAVSNQLQSIGSAIMNSLSSIVSAVENAISSALNNISATLQSFANTVLNAIKQVPTYLSQIGSSIMKALESVATTITNVVSNTFSTLSKYISTAFTNFVNALQSLGSEIFNALKGVYDYLANLAKSILDTLGNWGKTIINAISSIPSLVENALASVYKALQDIGNTIMNAIKGFIDNIGKFISGVADTLAKIWGYVVKIPETLVNFGKQVEDAISGVVKYIESAFNNVVKFMENLSNTLTQIGEQVSKAFNFVGTAFTGFINAILKFPEWFENNLVKPLADYFKPVIDFFKNLDLSNLGETVGKWLESFIADVIAGMSFIGEKILDGLKWAYSQLQGFFSWLATEINNALSWAWDAIQKTVSALWEALKDGATWLVNTFIINPIKAVIEDLMTSITDVFVYVAKSEGKVGEYGTLTLLALSLAGGLSIVIGVPYVIEGLADMIRTLELSAEPLGLGGKIKSDILGLLRRIAQFFKDQGKALVQALLIGSAIQLLDPVKYIIRPFSKNFFDNVFKKIYGDKYGIESFFEAPPLEQLRNLVRRALIYVDNFRDLAKGAIPDKTKQFLDAVKFLMYVRGYPFWFSDYYFDLGQQFAIYVHDRFYVQRFIPLSPVFELPTHSEIIRMLQRDVFTSPVEWSKFVRVYGMSDDLAKMFYMLSFQYPSFTQLWKFMTRGISGMLWYTAPSLAKEIFATEAQWLGAGVPIDPYKLNFNADALMNATAIYGKWIQKSNFSWFKKGMKLQYGTKTFTINFDWTADSWMLWDISADIPSKIDARWMVKWSLFDHLTRMLRLSPPSGGSAVKEYPQKPFVDIVKSVIESTMYSDVSMDLRPFCRMLVANGLHPAWVPLVAVAEAINALADERTLLRTGFLNLFKEGAWDYSTLDTFLDGMLIASFAVEYFDVETKKWYGGAINLPVRFLPAERKMLELRAIFDRALDIIRDYLKVMAKGVSQLILKPNEAMSKIKEYVEGNLGKWFSKATELASGFPIPLKLDEAWIQTYIKYYEELQNIETIMRARYYTRYLIYSIMWRFREGWITKEEMVNTLSNIVDEIKESPLFKKLLVQTADLMMSAFERELKAQYVISLLKRRKIDKKQAVEMLVEAGLTEELAKLYVDAKFTPYSVSLTTLATLCEVVPQAVKYALDSLKIFGFNPEELVYWSIYVAKKPYMNEMTLVRTRIYECLAEDVPPDKILDILTAYAIVPVWKDGNVVFEYGDTAKKLITYYEKHKDVLEGMGFDVREWIAFNLIAELEKLKRLYHEKTTPYIPTPLTLAGMMEYVSIPENLIENVFEYNRVPTEWVPIWRQYFKIKPVFDDVRLVVSALVRAIAYSAVSDKVANEVWELAKQYGYTDLEIKLQKLRADLEYAVEMVREYVPTPSMLANIAEIIPSARNYLPLVLKAKRIQSPWDKLWEQYVKVKPLIDDVKNLLRQVSRLYVNFYVKPEDLDKVLKVLPLYGWEETEIEMVKKALDFERWYTAFKSLIGTPRELVTMAEYSPTARSFALGQVYKMIDALPIDENTKKLLKAMWEEYIRVKPVYDEVKRYITELISDVQYGLLTVEEFKQELEKLKQWGIDDYEIQFYVWLAQNRRARQILREELYYYRGYY